MYNATQYCWYIGPYIVIRRRLGGSYICAELDGAISKMAYAAFRLIPYFPRRSKTIDIFELTGLSPEELDKATRDIPTLAEDDDVVEELPEPHLLD